MSRRFVFAALALALLLLALPGALVPARAQASGPAPAACAEPLQLQRALRTLQRPRLPDAGQTVALPDSLPPAARDENQRIRYTLDVAACAGSPAAALWLFRVGAPYRLWDQDGRELPLLSARTMMRPELVLGQRASAQQALYNGRIPALFGLQPGTRSVTVELQTLAFLPAGIVRASVGPAQALLPVQAQAVDEVVAHADTAAQVVLVLGALALLLWLQRRRDRSLMWLAVACGLWGLRGLLYFGHSVYLPPTAFEQFNPLNVLLASSALTASVLALTDGLVRSSARLLAGATALGVLALAAAQVAGEGALAARALVLVLSAALITGLLVRIWRVRSRLAPREVAILVGALGGLLLCAAHDMMVVRGALPPDSGSWVFWGFVAMLVGFCVMSGQYVVLTLNRAERSNEELEAHVARKTAELELSYARLRESEREAARTQERERLLRDMHDGLGAQLMTALRGVERGALGPAQVAQSLQDGLDELRLLMDSTDMGHYLPGALAAWRNRWDARLQAAGVRLHWRIDESMDAVQLPGDSALQVLRILQEAATNIVKHAGARNMVLDARVLQEGGAPLLRIAIEDDGCGLAGEASARAGARGLKNMRHRALAIGAELRLDGAQGGCGTRVELSLALAGQPAQGEPAPG